MMTGEPQSSAAPAEPGRRAALGRLLGYGVAAYLAVVILLGLYWSIPPAAFDVRGKAADLTQTTQQAAVTGVATTAALIGVIDTLLDKRGGFVYNDLLPPGLWLDNMPNWEYGVLIQSRDLARSMREVYSRSQSQSREDVDLARAEPQLNFSASSWIMPASESEYRQARRHLESYLGRLVDEADTDAQFFARADNLRYWLSSVENRLGSLSQRLSASVGQRRINTDLAGEDAARQSTSAPAESDVKTPWLEIDDVFYEARGAAWALLHFMRAADIDFADVLERKNARISLQQIIRELESTQKAVWSPVILNGSGFGVLANHSLVMGSYISRAHAAMIDLRDLLSRG
jgi:hypothetical protein